MKTYKNFKLSGLILGIFLIANTASAALLIEPHLGYNIHGSGDNGGTKYSYNGPQLGARVGYQTIGLMAGLDYTRSSGSMEAKSNGTTKTDDFTTNDLGVFVGYNFPILVRAWGTYYFNNTSKYKSTSAEVSGSTKELGVGFTGLPFLSVNLVYRMINHDELEAANGSKASINNDYNEIVLGISLPLTL